MSMFNPTSPISPLNPVSPMKMTLLHPSGKFCWNTPEGCDRNLKMATHVGLVLVVVLIVTWLLIHWDTNNDKNKH